jgi:hypothetical protein
MISELEFDPRDYHLRLMIEQMQRNGRSEDAIENAVRTVSDCKPSTTSQPGTMRLFLGKQHPSFWNRSSGQVHRFPRQAKGDSI